MMPDPRWPVALMPDGSFRSFAEWGCYPVMHVTADGGSLCDKCANENIEQCKDPDGDNQWRVVASDIVEGSSYVCDHCNEPFDTDAYESMIAEQTDE